MVLCSFLFHQRLNPVIWMTFQNTKMTIEPLRSEYALLLKSDCDALAVLSFTQSRLTDSKSMYVKWVKLRRVIESTSVIIWPNYLKESVFALCSSIGLLVLDIALNTRHIPIAFVTLIKF